jgi:hypothetical protein
MGLKCILSLFYKYKSQFLQLIGGHIQRFLFFIFILFLNFDEYMS